MITTDKNVAVSEFDIVVRVGKFPKQGKKLVIQKGGTVISVSGDDVAALVNAIEDVVAFKSVLVPTFGQAADLCDTCPAR